MDIKIQNLIDNAHCYDTVRELRWPEKVYCPHYKSIGVLVGRGTLEKEKLPIFGAIQRGGEVVIRMLANVKQVTIKPIIESLVASGTLI